MPLIAAGYRRRNNEHQHSAGERGVRHDRNLVNVPRKTTGTIAVRNAMATPRSNFRTALARSTRREIAIGAETAPIGCNGVGQ
jgi:hypothetical protein